MPKQKLTTPERYGNIWIIEYRNSEAFIDMLHADGGGVADRAFATAFARQIITETIEACAREADKIDTALNDGTITRKEIPDWKYSRASVVHTNASIYVEQVAIAIRALLPEVK